MGGPALVKTRTEKPGEAWAGTATEPTTVKKVTQKANLRNMIDVSLPVVGESRQACADHADGSPAAAPGRGAAADDEGAAGPVAV
ncbi:hypothetical protein Rhe02_42030 [Rhizocola hellebori]|uniref:Uncharacterized protein n=1 Tax=Rhizocola hellebori TaxID=1392758 RepID=A0A8J3Q910_9ACTN|nr:hypothetical protein Rhe02_42030 [Rhizocola hellebori]